jgi:hypothetical protein
MATLVELDGVGPGIGRDVFLAPTAVLVGDAPVKKRLDGETRDHPQRAPGEYKHRRVRYPTAASTA